MTDTKPVSVQACNGQCPAEETSTTRFHSPLAEQPPFNTVALLPRSGNRTDTSTDSLHLLQATVMTAADQRGSTVMAEIMTIFGGSIAEELGPLGSTDHVVDRIRTDLVDALASFDNQVLIHD